MVWVDKGAVATLTDAATAALVGGATATRQRVDERAAAAANSAVAVSEAGEMQRVAGTLSSPTPARNAVDARAREIFPQLVGSSSALNEAALIALQNADLQAQISWYRGIIPASVTTSIKSGRYLAQTYAMASGVSTPAGPLPDINAGWLEVDFVDTSRQRMAWSVLSTSAKYEATRNGGEWSTWRRVDAGAVTAQSWLKGLIPVDMSTITEPGLYVADTFSYATTITSPVGKLPDVNAGSLIYSRTPNVHMYLWFNATTGTAWIASNNRGDWQSWKRIGGNGSLSEIGAAPAIHDHDDAYYQKSEVDSGFASVGGDIAATLAVAKAYTDAAFSASAPGGATDESLDAAIDRAILSGRLVNSAVMPELAADGSTDDAPVLQAALDSAVTFGHAVMLPRSGTVAVGGKITVPAGVTLIGSGARIRSLLESPRGVVSVQEDAHLSGELTVEVSGVNALGVTFLSRAKADKLTVTSPTLGAGGDHSTVWNDGIRIAGDDVSIAHAQVEGFDFPFAARDVSGLSVGKFVARNWVRGFYLENVKRARIGEVDVALQSPNTQYAAGHNGILIEASEKDSTQDIRIEIATVRDSGEHGIRFAGRMSRIRFGVATVIGAGGSGLKAWGKLDAATSGFLSDLSITNLHVEDCGTHPVEGALMLHFCKRVDVGHLAVVANKNTYGATTGLEIQGSHDVTIRSHMIDGVSEAGVRLRPVRGSISRLSMPNGSIRAAGAGIEFVRGSDVAVSYDDILISSRVDSGQAAVASAAGASSIGGVSVVDVYTQQTFETSGDLTGVTVNVIN